MGSWKGIHAFDTGPLHHSKIKGRSQMTHLKKKKKKKKTSSLTKNYLFANSEKMSQMNLKWFERGKADLESCSAKVKAWTSKHIAPTSDSWGTLGGSGKAGCRVRREWDTAQWFSKLTHVPGVRHAACFGPYKLGTARLYIGQFISYDHPIKLLKALLADCISFISQVPLISFKLHSILTKGELKMKH